MNGYSAYLENWLTAQRACLHLVEQLPSPTFKSLSFATSEINLENFERWVRELKYMEIDNRTPVLYYIDVKLPFDGAAICSHINKIKMSQERSPLMLPKVNVIQDNDSTVLYVGKTNQNFLQRFKSHLGIYPNRTYALQLAGWAIPFNLSLTLHVARYSLAKDKLHMLEQVEHILHYNLKPILGRAGH